MIVHTCPNPDCRIAETGKCVEGFEVDECPHQKSAPVIVEEPAFEADNDIGETISEEEDATVGVGFSGVPVASGDILNIDEATDVLCSSPTRVITVVGPYGSGKTTLGLSFYEAFQQEPFGSWNFAGSLTLQAFEERCHFARAQSGKSKPDTPRTSISDGLVFLHLAVHSEKTRRIDLLISDRSGEFYTSVANSLENCENLHEVSRADQVLFLVDGKAMASDERHGVKNDTKMMIEAMVTGGVLGKNHRVGVVLTKYDHVVSCGLTDRVEEDFARFVEKLRLRFGSRLAEINDFKISARSEDDSVDTRFGVLEVLEECLRPRRHVAFEAESIEILDRSFLRLRERAGGASE